MRTALYSAALLLSLLSKGFSMDVFAVEELYLSYVYERENEAPFYRSRGVSLSGTI